MIEVAAIALPLRDVRVGSKRFPLTCVLAVYSTVRMR